MKIYLLRHTKPEIEEGICYGQTDIGLSETFGNELSLIKREISRIEFDGIFSSPLKRCKLLAESLCPENMEIIPDKRLMEMNFGSWEMMHWQDISKSSEAQKWFNDHVNVKCPHGESFMDLYNRVKDFLNRLKQSRFRNPLIITHGGVIRAFYSMIESQDLRQSFDLKINYGELKTFQL